MRLRLTLLVVTVFGVISVTLSILRLLYLQKQVTNFFDDRLRESSDLIVRQLETTRPPFTPEVLGTIAARQPRAAVFEQFVLCVFDQQGTEVGCSRPSEVAFDACGGKTAVATGAPVLRRLRSGENDEDTRRTIARSFHGAGWERYVMILATRDTFVQLLLSQMRGNIVLSTPIALIAAAVAGWFVAGFAVKPYQRLSEFMRSLRPESLRQQVEINNATPEVARLQEDLNAAMKRLDEGYQAQERFTANVSHELKTPIATVLTEAQTLGKHRNLPEDVTHFIRSTEDEMRRLGKMVESFLLLARVRDGKAALAGQRLYPVNELVMDSAEHCKAMAEMHGVTIRIHLKDTQQHELLVFGDPELLRTMIDNVIRNAIRFSPQQQAVEVTVDVDAREALIRVRDYGAGIPEEVISKIFDRFTQAKTEERLNRGSGLGLEIAQGIAELHGGGISAENCLGGGCAFTIRLPLTRAKPDAI